MITKKSFNKFSKMNAQYTFILEIITVLERNISIILDEIHRQER